MSWFVSDGVVVCRGAGLARCRAVLLWFCMARTRVGVLQARACGRPDTYPRISLGTSPITFQ
ncbi:hypothetical protein F7R21_04900 [Burkholderia latens]|uniref:Uncharacterized protein n=1 Tax=Burkholderia latens TaxID=488446 RepID=A0A6H9TUG2_9BURK|nr:hypothetical protein F7R21_04900 [Burkholderia latens]